MNLPLEISFRKMRKSEMLESLIREKAAKLEEVCDHITSCRVIVEQPEKHQRSGRPYHVRLDIGVPPGHRIAVHSEPKVVEQTDSADTEIRHAFNEAFRQLKKLNERQHHHAKIHEQHRSDAVVENVLYDQGFGFLRTQDNRQIYFHKNACQGNDFLRLTPGTGVYFNESLGEQGPQATYVNITEKPGVETRLNESDVM